MRQLRERANAPSRPQHVEDAIRLDPRPDSPSWASRASRRLGTLLTAVYAARIIFLPSPAGIRTGQRFARSRDPVRRGRRGSIGLPMRPEPRMRDV